MGARRFCVRWLGKAVSAGRGAGVGMVWWANVLGLGIWRACDLEIVILQRLGEDARIEVTMMGSN